MEHELERERMMRSRTRPVAIVMEKEGWIRALEIVWRWRERKKEAGFWFELLGG